MIWHKHTAASFKEIPIKLPIVLILKGNGQLAMNVSYNVDIKVKDLSRAYKEDDRKDTIGKKYSPLTLIKNVLPDYLKTKYCGLLFNLHLVLWMILWRKTK
jgi:hypothetical protein